MRNIILSSVASIVLFGGALSQSALADTQANRDQQQTVTVTAGQGGSFTIEVPATVQNPGPVDQTVNQAVAVTAGNGGTVTAFVPAAQAIPAPEQAMTSADGQ